MATYSNTNSVSASSPSTLTNPSLLVVGLTIDDPTATPTLAGYATDSSVTTGSSFPGAAFIFSKQNAGTAQVSPTISLSGNAYGRMIVCQIVGAPTSSALDVAGNFASSSVTPNVTLTTTQGNDSVFAMMVTSQPSPPGDTSYTVLFGPTAVQFWFHIGEEIANIGTAGAHAVSFGMSNTGVGGMLAAAAYKTASPPVATGNSGGIGFFP